MPVFLLWLVFGRCGCFVRRIGAYLASVYWVQRWFEKLLYCRPAVDGMYRILRACMGTCSDGVLLPPRLEGYVAIVCGDVRGSPTGSDMFQVQYSGGRGFCLSVGYVEYL
jgi:hypothetical protein